jgi:hypothetical protein
MVCLGRGAADQVVSDFGQSGEEGGIRSDSSEHFALDGGERARADRSGRFTSRGHKRSSVPEVSKVASCRRLRFEGRTTVIPPGGLVPEKTHGRNHGTPGYPL